METYGPYRLVTRLAQGGMGEVFKATLHRPGGFVKTLALKRVLPPAGREAEFAARFTAEARLSAKLNHRNLVQIYDFGEQDGTWFIAMEYVDGLDLARVLSTLAEQGRRLPPRLALWIVAELCRGLDYAHTLADENGCALRLVHRDISPSNILLSAQGDVKLSDFGLAISRDNPDDSDLLAGKRAYMAPEQWRGEPVDARLDLYALGLVAVEMLTGARVFSGAMYETWSGAEIAARLADAPLALREWVAQACAAEKADRFASAAEMGAAAECVRREWEPEALDEPRLFFASLGVAPAPAPVEPTLVVVRHSAASAAPRRRALLVLPLAAASLLAAWLWWPAPEVPVPSSAPVPATPVPVVPVPLPVKEARLVKPLEVPRERAKMHVVEGRKVRGEWSLRVPEGWAVLADGAVRESLRWQEETPTPHVLVLRDEARQRKLVLRVWIEREELHFNLDAQPWARVSWAAHRDEATPLADRRLSAGEQIVRVRFPDEDETYRLIFTLR